MRGGEKPARRFLGDENLFGQRQFFKDTPAFPTSDADARTSVSANAFHASNPEHRKMINENFPVGPSSAWLPISTLKIKRKNGELRQRHKNVPQIPRHRSAKAVAKIGQGIGKDETPVFPDDKGHRLQKARC